VVQRTDYDEFGNVIRCVGIRDCRLGASGLYDPDTGLVRFERATTIRNREVDSEGPSGLDGGDQHAGTW
jgi:hypothetical protein